MKVTCSIRVLRKAVQRGSSLIFSRSGTLVTTSSRVESESKDGREGWENGRENVRVLTGGNLRERESRFSSLPRRWFAAWKWIYDAQPMWAERYLLRGRVGWICTQQQVPFLYLWFACQDTERQEMETAEIPGKLDSRWLCNETEMLLLAGVNKSINICV